MSLFPPSSSTHFIANYTIMARLRKEKGGSSHSTQPKSGSKKSKTAPDEVLREQVLALGGTQEDIALMKSTGKKPVNDTTNDDPALSKDVSAFLKGLDLGANEPQDTGKGKPSKSEKTAKKPAKSRAQQKDSAPIEQSKTHTSAPTTSISRKANKKPKKPDVKQAEPVPFKPEPPAEVPKVQLPTKMTFNPKSPFVSQPIALWHTATPPLAPPQTPLPLITPDQLSSLTQKASDLHYADIRTFQTSSSSNSSSSEANFLSKIISSGTLSDRLSALTLLVQSSPIHNTKALETLKGMAERGKGKGGREESLKALRCIVDWWVGGGAPDRKLKYFRDQPLNHPAVTDEHLLMWYFEDWLKKYFFSILQILETLSLDPLQYVRTQSLTLIFTLLRDKPEQEQNLLRLLVNKLGDTEKSLCSRASYHLLQLLQSHPSMKGVIVREIIALVLRPPAPSAPTPHLPASTGKHIRFTDGEDKPKPKAKLAGAPGEKKSSGNAHARYYATITFNQIVLTPGDREVALKLVDVYFELFKELLGEDAEDVQDVEEEGVEGVDEEVITDKKGRVKIRNVKGKKGKGKGRVTEVKGAAGFAEVEDAHSRLISAILTGVNRALPFAKIDSGDVRLNKHIDTLFLITHTSTFNISLQALVLIQQISSSLTTSTSASSSSTSKSITDRYYRTLYDSLHDTRLAASSKQAMYLNLLFKSIKADAGNADGERVKAIVRRFVQVLISGGGGATEFIAGGLFLLGELFSTVPGLRAMVNKPAKPDAEPYDPRKRDPQYAHASSSPLWELTPLLHHYHPAVSLHARQLLTSQPLTASADLSQNTLSHFLDRFVYKNPKKIKETENAATLGKAKGASAMQPAASGLDGTGVKLLKGEVEDGTLMNDDNFLRKKAEDVPVDQLFYHKYFSKKSEKEKAKAAKVGKRKGEESDEESDDEDGRVESAGSDEGEDEGVLEEDGAEDSDASEAEVWKAMKASMPKAAGDDSEDLMEDDGDEDDLPSDFDMDDDDSDSENEDQAKEEDDDALSLVEGSDNEDLISLNDDVPDGLIEWDGSDEEADEEWGGIDGDDGGGGKKRKREETSREKRKKLRSLPTFASYEDYAKMIEDVGVEAYCQSKPIIRQRRVGGLGRRHRSRRPQAPVTVGIRREDPQRIWERRAPLTPRAVRDLVAYGVNVEFEHCDRRVYQDADYIQAGATLRPNLENAHIVVGIKETPLDEVITAPVPAPSNSKSARSMSARTHLMFSHTAKGQPYNIPLLAKYVGDVTTKALPDGDSPRLIDYELLTNDMDGKRTVGFGWFAGVAGVLESLSSMAHSHLENGIASPFLSTPRPHTHPSLKSLRIALKDIKVRIQNAGTPPTLGPFVIGLTGTGNVSQGCLDILSELPIENVSVKDLHSLVTNKVRLDGQPYERSHYYAHPQSYRSTFCETVAPYLTLFLNGTGWSPTFPRLMTKEQLPIALDRARALGGARFTNIGDISCDVEGGLEFLDRATTLSSPFYKISPPTVPGGTALPSIQMMSVDILPASLPLDASRHFSHALFPYLESLIKSYQTGARNEHTEALERATIAQNGMLVGKHTWLQTTVDSFYAAGSMKNEAAGAAPVSRVNVADSEPDVEVAKGRTAPLRKKNVLMLGSGMVAGPAVEEIAKRADVQLVVAGNSVQELEKLGREYLNIQYRVIDILDQDIILLPAPFHSNVAKLCIDHKKHLVTASYVSKDMRELHDSAVDADVLLLNEIGLDPGIDHCSAIDLMSTLRSQKKNIVSFTSFCGGLPAPDVEHTPLRYKFSWNPKGVLLAALNPAKFRLDNVLFNISEEKLLKKAFPEVPITKEFDLEGIANRNSLIYAEQYGIESARTVLRGTLRYPGFASLMQSFRALGFLESKRQMYLNNWPSYIKKCLSNQLGTEVEPKATSAAISSVVVPEKIPELHDALDWLGLLPSPGHRGPLPALPAAPMTALDIFAYLLAHKLAYKPGERDMVVLSHEIVTQKKGSPEKEVHTSSLITYGTPRASAMARTVGIPVAIAALQVLDGTIALRGVQGPTDASIYKPVLHGLEELGLGMTESTRVVGSGGYTLEAKLIEGVYRDYGPNKP
ncbi:hypothetical protein D9615_007633 [Tricholomella constricta]|uniref:Alanine dehydrogenase/pyridine nucleotide transhydrogenase N-terminal domain-containing protein n=1 Tax=Tricholomella constricta TaxID=117010 RepID=A0A8H5H732_9AGAR|nr:hypothetical protein D9615_007633 [Tricholomella constricta]